MTDTPRRLLQALGVHLADPLPLFILAALASRRHLLLVGLPGQAKTALARAVGACLAPGRTRVLNAALTSFDDVRGFVRPGSLETGRVEIVPGPWSPYEDRFLFVDELSRAPAHLQSRWLQLIHEREVDGVPTRIEWVVAAMNPPSVDGTFPLGLATVDRFHAVLHLDDFSDLDLATRAHIAAGLVGPPRPATDPEEVDPGLTSYFDAISERVAALSADPALRLALGRITVAALDGFMSALPPFRPQGRRAVFLTELALSLLGLLEVELGDADLARAQLGDLLDAWLTAGLTGLGRAADLDEVQLAAAHEAAWRGAMRGWEEAFAVVGPRGRARDVLDGRAAPSPSALAALLDAELARPTLEPKAFQRLAARAWHGAYPSLEEHA